MEALNLPRYTTTESTPKLSSALNPQVSLENALNSIFPQQSEENKVTRTRRILWQKAETLSDEQIECVVAEFQFLIDNWLDEYEREVFKGLTLKEVLNEK